MALSPCGRILAGGSPEGPIRLINMDTGETLRMMQGMPPEWREPFLSRFLSVRPSVCP